MVPDIPYTQREREGGTSSIVRQASGGSEHSTMHAWPVTCEWTGPRTTGSVAYSRGLFGFRIHWGSSLALGWETSLLDATKGPCVTLYARTSGDVPRPWTSLGRPRTTPDVPARPGTSAWDVPARPGTVGRPRTPPGPHPWTSREAGTCCGEVAPRVFSLRLPVRPARARRLAGAQRGGRETPTATVDRCHHHSAE